MPVAVDGDRLRLRCPFNSPLRGLIYGCRMEPSHLVEADAQARSLHLKLSGFFDGPAIERFVRDREAGYAKLGPAGDHVTMCDVTECKIQSAESFEQFRALLMERRRWGRRMAFVAPEGSLAALQIKRLIAERADLRVFYNIMEGWAWLREPCAIRPSAMRLDSR